MSLSRGSHGRARGAATHTSTSPQAVGQALLDSVGRTPLVPIEQPKQLDTPIRSIPPGVRIFAKLESVNPGGSLKDRPASRIMINALARGKLSGNRSLLDSSSGNAGIAYAMFGAALSVPVTLVVPGNATRERLDRISAYGARIIRTDPIEGYDFAIKEAARLAVEQPQQYWYANQYANDDNWLAHYHTTGEEILQQVQEATGALPDAFVAGVGTGGTLTGIGRRIKEATPDACILAVIPERFPGIEGLKPLGDPDDLVPEILDQSLIDRRIDVSIDEAITMSSHLARQGLFVGPSSGAYLHAAWELAYSGEHRTIVTLLNDTGERYGSTGMWENRAAEVP